MAGMLGATAALFAGSDITERAMRLTVFAKESHARSLLTSTTFFPSAFTTLENQRPGTTRWMLEEGADTTGIQGYAGAVSALPGDTVPLYISVTTPTTYTIEMYRMGWYAGAGGRLVFSQADLPGMAQGTWTSATGLVGSATSISDPETLLLDANWSPSFALTIGADWPTGIYLIKLTAANGAQSYIPLVVRALQAQSAMLFSLPVNTYQAYNLWGGSSLYGIAGMTLTEEGDAAQTDANAALEHAALMFAKLQARGSLKATNVSFNRPYARCAGAGDFLSWDIHLVQWLERNGMDVAYTTNVDLAMQPDAMLAHRVAVFGSHDEYWTTAMRDGAEMARDQGVSLAFLGANAAYWHARLEPDAAGHANRTLVCYKVATRTRDPLAALVQDPLYSQQPSETTSLWRDPVLNRPENALLGLMYRSYFKFQRQHNGNYYLPHWVVNTGPLDRLFAGTGLVPGQQIAGGILGYEYDALFHNGSTPTSLVILARSPLTNVYHHQDRACSAYYRAASGAMVFDAGSIWWSWGLSELVPRGAYQPNLMRGNEAINLFMRNVMEAMLSASTTTAPAL
jgi:hypothetical protein